jgi:malonyl-CoA O-methyltransferase
MPAQPPATATALDPNALRHVLARMARADAASWLHGEVARRMAERLPVIREAPQRWLDWWGFTGGGATAVQAVLPKARRTVVEPTPALLQRSRGQLRGAWWAPWRNAGRSASAVLDEQEVPAGQAQLLWANMMLQTSPEPALTMAAWHRALAVGGYLMFSTYGPDTLKELRALYAEQGWPAPHLPFADMHDLGDMLVHAGFADPVMDQETLRLTWTSAEALLAELRGLGGHLGARRWPGLRTPRWRESLLQGLQRRADAQGRIMLSIEVVYGHAFKAPPRPARGEPATVSLESLRLTMGKHRRAGSAQ